MNDFDWTKITKKSGDSGTSDVLFKTGIPKSDPVFHVLALGEHAKVQLGFVVQSLDVDLECSYLRFQTLENLMRSWEDLMVLLLGCASAHASNAVDKYQEKFKRIDDQDVADLDTLVSDIGEYMNDWMFGRGWSDYTQVCTPASLALHEFTTRIRLLEQAVYAWLDRDDDDPENLPLKPERAFLNRLSKVSFMLAVVTD